MKSLTTTAFGIVCFAVAATAYADLTGIATGYNASQSIACDMAKRSASSDAQKNRAQETAAVTSRGQTVSSERVTISDCSCARSPSTWWNCTVSWALHLQVIAGERQSKIAPQPSQRQDSKKSGTGFYVSGDGYLITNAHVVDACHTINAVDGTAQRTPLRIVRVLKSDDLALLKANTAPKSFAVFRESPRINQGETVVAYGFPLTGLLASGGNVSTGLVTALAGVGDDARQMQISAPVQPGNSGGPLVDSRGLVIGVIVSKLDWIAVARSYSNIPENINFAIKSSSVINLLEMSSVKYRSEKLQRDLSVEALTQQVKDYTVRIECN